MVLSHGVFSYRIRTDFHGMHAARRRRLTQRLTGLQLGANAPHRVRECIHSRKTDCRPARRFHHGKVLRRHGVGGGLVSQPARGHELTPSVLNLRFSDFGNNVVRSWDENSSGVDTVP